MTPVDESLFAPDRHVTPPKGVDGVVVNVRRVAQEPFYCLGLTRRIQREWDSSSAGYALFGTLAILADHLVSGLLYKWNLLFHGLWTSKRTAKGGETPPEKLVEPPVKTPVAKAVSAPNPVLAELFNAFIANPHKSIKQLADEHFGKTD